MAEQRYRAVLEVGTGVPVTEVAERYGVSRQSVHAWLVRYRLEGIAGLEDRSHQVHHHPWRIPAEVEELVCELRRAHPKWGPRRLVFEVGRRGHQVTRSSVYRSLVRGGLVEPKSRRRRRKDYRRWERGTAMELWQLDVTASAFVTGGTEVKIVTGVDDHSRFCVLATAVMRATARPVCLAFVDAMRVYGVPEEVLTDNGKGVHWPVPQARGGGGGAVRQDLPGERHHLPAHQDPFPDDDGEDRAAAPDPPVLDRLYPDRVKLRASDVAGLREAWSMVERLWAATTERALRLPEAVQRERVGGEWSIVETLRHLVFATDCWLFRAIRLEPNPYHPWALPWSGATWSSPMRLAWTHRPRRASRRSSGYGATTSRLCVRRSRISRMLGLAEVRAAPDSPGHPTGEHPVLQCLHVLLNEEWEHHRYTVRDLDVLDPAKASGS